MELHIRGFKPSIWRTNADWIKSPNRVFDSEGLYKSCFFRIDLDNQSIKWVQLSELRIQFWPSWFTYSCYICLLELYCIVVVLTLLQSISLERFSFWSLRTTSSGLHGFFYCFALLVCLVYINTNRWARPVAKLLTLLWLLYEKGSSQVDTVIEEW